MSAEKDWAEQGFHPIGEGELPEKTTEKEKVNPDVSGMVPVKDNDGNVIGYTLPEKTQTINQVDEVAALLDQAKGTIDTPEAREMMEAIGFIPENNPIKDAPDMGTSDPDDLKLSFDDSDEEVSVIPEPPKAESKVTETKIDDIKVETVVSRKEEDWRLILVDEEEIDEDSEELSEREKMLMALPIIEYGVNEPIRNKLTLQGQNVSIDSKKVQRVMTDTDFMAAFDKIQRKIRDKVKAPLINSGFTVEVIGGGMLQLADVYDVGDEDRNIDYELKKYRTMLESIASPTPRMNQADLPKLFYWGDYQILSWAFVCATIDKIEHLVECQKDHTKAFRISGSPIDLLEIDESFQLKLSEMEKLTHKNMIESLVDRTNIFTDSYETKITLRHPNYKFGNKVLKDIKQVYKTPDIAEDLKNLLNRPLIRELMFYIDEIEVYGQISADTLIKKLYYLRSMSEKDLTALGKIAGKMEEETYKYKFSFRDIPCPICGENHTYSIGDIDGMVFQSRRLMYLLSLIERRQSLSGENTEGKNSNSTNE